MPSGDGPGGHGPPTGAEMAYLKELLTLYCIQCGQKATHELRNGQNILIGYVCRRCGERALAGMQQPATRRLS